MYLWHSMWRRSVNGLTSVKDLEQRLALRKSAENRIPPVIPLSRNTTLLRSTRGTWAQILPFPLANHMISIRLSQLPDCSFLGFVRMRTNPRDAPGSQRPIAAITVLNGAPCAVLCVPVPQESTKVPVG